MQILQAAVGADTMDIWFSPASESLYLLANFTKLSKCSNFPSIMRIVSMDEREIFHLMKWATILDLTDASLLILIPSPMTSRPWLFFDLRGRPRFFFGLVWLSCS